MIAASVVAAALVTMILSRVAPLRELASWSAVAAATSAAITGRGWSDAAAA